MGAILRSASEFATVSDLPKLLPSMAKARAIVKRRKAVRNIRKITKTMQMIATAKFQKSLKRAVGTKPYTQKARELVTDLARTIGQVNHPLLRRPSAEDRTGRIVLVVVTSNRGLAGAYNGSVLRKATAFMREREAAGETVELQVIGKKGISYFNYQRRPIAVKSEAKDVPAFEGVNRAVEPLIRRFVDGEVDSVQVAYMNFNSTGLQRPEVLTILPLAGLKESLDRLALQVAEKESQMKAGALDARRSGENLRAEEQQ